MSNYIYIVQQFDIFSYVILVNNLIMVLGPAQQYHSVAVNSDWLQKMMTSAISVCM